MSHCRFDSGSVLFLECLFRFPARAPTDLSTPLLTPAQMRCRQRFEGLGPSPLTSRTKRLACRRKLPQSRVESETSEPQRLATAETSAVEGLGQSLGFLGWSA